MTYELRSWIGRCGLCRVAIACYRTIVVSIITLSSQALIAQQPLHVRIDQAIAATHVGEAAPVVGDFDFVRRVYLDLTGANPSAAVARSFVADANPSKRRALIERLLASPEHARFMAGVFDVMWMERRGDKHIKAAEWQTYLFESFKANKPYNVLVREILAADGVDPALRPAARFVMERDVETNTLTRDVGRMFFGMDLGCAQCHDHPAIDGFKQAEYYGIYAFLNRSYLFTDKEKKVFIADKADGDVNFTSVFTKEADKSAPRLPGDVEITEPVINAAEAYTVAPADNVRPVPKYSRRLKLAELATNGSNRYFNRNIANRLWKHMMGAGLVDPLDMHHLDNPPTNGPLLEMLADEMVAMKFDMRAFLLELAMTQAYQRSLDVPTNLVPGHAKDAVAQIPALEAEREKIALAASVSVTEATKALGAVKESLKAAAPVQEELNKANAAVTEARKGADASAKALAEAQKKQADLQAIATAVAEAAQKTQEAAAKLPEEKDLAQAAEKFKAKSAALEPQLAAAQKTVTDVTPPAKAAADALAAKVQTATEATTKLQAANQQVSQLKVTARNQEIKAISEGAAAKQLDVRVWHLKAMVEFAAKETALQSLRTSLSTVQADLTAKQQTMAKLAAELPKKQAELAEAQKANDEMSKSLADVRQQRDTKQNAVTTFADVVAKAEAASQKLPEDAELKQVALTVKTRSDQLATELATMQKTFVDKETIAKAAAEKLVAVQQQMATMQTEMTTCQQAIPNVEAKLKDEAAKLEAEKLAYGSTVDQMVSSWNRRFLASSLRAKNPEQMGWSILQATGVLDNYREAAEAEVNKTLPLDAAAMADQAKLAARAVAIEQNIYGKLASNINVFVGLFGHAAAQPQGEFYATADQPLFFGNGGVLTSWLAPSGNNLTSRMMKLEDPKAIADELYISVLTRNPTEAEIADVVQSLAARPMEKAAVVQELAWGLITSAEFRFIQ